MCVATAPPDEPRLQPVQSTSHLETLSPLASLEAVDSISTARTTQESITLFSRGGLQDISGDQTSRGRR